jgi:hypothetical protein
MKERPKTQLVSLQISPMLLGLLINSPSGGSQQDRPLFVRQYYTNLRLRGFVLSTGLLLRR